MKKLMFCLVIFLLVGSILYAQTGERYPRKSFQEPKAMGKEESSEKYGRFIQAKEGGFKREDMLQRLETEDPETYAMYKELSELDEKARDLAEEYNAGTSPKGKEKIKSEIQGVLNKAFDLKLAIGERRLNNLKEKLSKLEKLAENRKANKDEIIKKHLENLLRQEDELRW